MATTRRTPTVVVARTVRPGREREFERWVSRLLAAARQAPGYLDAELQRPSDINPSEWIIVYQFSEAVLLSRWLISPERTTLMAEGADLIEGEAREQVVALTSGGEPVTAVSSVRVRPGAEEMYLGLYGEMLERLRHADGFVRCELLEPVAGVQDDTVVMYSFDTRAHLDAWLDSTERREILDRMEPIVEGTRTVNVIGGFAGWFGPVGSSMVKRWKQAVVVLVALVPVTLGVTALRLAVLPDLAWVPAALLGNVVGVVVLTWVAMPQLTRRLEPWLRR